MNKTIENIFLPYSRDINAIYLYGRNSLFDLDINTQNESIQPLHELLRIYAREKYGMMLVRYSTSTGVVCNTTDLKKHDADTVTQLLQSYNIQNQQRSQQQNPEDEFVQIMRGIIRLVNDQSTLSKLWLNDLPVRFLFLFEFSSNLLPNLESGNLTRPQMIAMELCYLLANGISLRKAGHYCIFTSPEDSINPTLRKSLHNLYLPFPTVDEKKSFIEILHKYYPDATYESGLQDNQVAYLNNSVPNKPLEGLFRTSNKNKTKISSLNLIEQKGRDIISISDSTLSLLDSSRVKKVNLVGRNIDAAYQFLKDAATGLKNNNPLTPTNILLLGGPASGKTDLSLKCAADADVLSIEMLSPKGGIVGQTESRSRLQQRILSELSPCWAFIDEITEAFPLQRGEHNLDSGASAAVTAALLNALSDSTRAGKTVICATSNCGWRIGDAMLGRFTVVPVLSPLLSDYPSILKSIAMSIIDTIDFSDSEDDLRLASEIFYRKNISPRGMMKSLKESVNLFHKLTPKIILEAAHDAMPLDHRSRMSSIYADLYAIKLCASKKLLPWYNKSDYDFPEYIKKVLDNNNELDPEKLENELQSLKPFVNV